MLKAVVFDFDGIIADTEPTHYHALMQVLRPMGIDFDYQHYLKVYVGFDDRDCFRAAIDQLRLDGKDIPPIDLDEFIARKSEAWQDIIAHELKPIAGALQLVESCAQHVPIAIASGALRQEIELIARSLNIIDHFACIVAADDVDRSKPDPMTYTRAVEELDSLFPHENITPKHCLAIEDTPSGVISARDAGLMTLAVAGTVPAQQIAQAHRVIDTMQNLNFNQLRQWYEPVE